MCQLHLSRVLTLATLGIMVPDQNADVINLQKSLSNIKNFLSYAYKYIQKGKNSKTNSILLIWTALALTAALLYNLRYGTGIFFILGELSYSFLNLDQPQTFYPLLFLLSWSISGNFFNGKSFADIASSVTSSSFMSQLLS